MVKILRLKDRVKLKVDEVTFTIAPLDYRQKQHISECTKIVNGNEVFDLLKAQVLYIKYALKDVSGVESYDGSEYKLQFENDQLTDDCVSEILCLEQREKLTISAWQLLNGIQEIKDPITGEKLDGVELEVESGK